VRLVVAIAIALTWFAMRDATAAPRKVLVLKLDGNVDPAERVRLQAEIARLATERDVEVTSGNTTLAETASAVGCDPSQTSCLETVRQTLGVDEIAYGTATVAPDHRVELDVHHLPPKDQHASIVEGEPLVYGAHRSTPPSPQPQHAVDRRDRNFAIAAFAGSGVALLIGITLWTQESSKQDDIDAHPTMTTAQLQDLKQLEDQASTYGWYGNAMMVIGLGLGGVGAYLLYRDHQQHPVVVAPTPGGIAIGGVW
jgi:hypothetical protein